MKLCIHILSVISIMELYLTKNWNYENELRDYESELFVNVTTSLVQFPRPVINRFQANLQIDVITSLCRLILIIHRNTV